MENEALLSGKSLPIILIGGGKLQPIRERILAIIERWSAVISSAEAVLYYTFGYVQGWLQNTVLLL